MFLIGNNGDFFNSLVGDNLSNLFSHKMLVVVTLVLLERLLSDW